MHSWNVTLIHPLALVMTFAMGVLILWLPRRWALLPVVVTGAYMTLGQRLVIGGLDFTMLRILVLFGWTRLMTRGELRPLQLHGLDKAIIWWCGANVIFHTLLWQNGDAFVNRLGQSFDAIGVYFLVRALVRDTEDIRRVTKAVVVVPSLLALAMLIEHATSRNFFSFLGGVPTYTIIRDGKLRAQGSFAHPILAGTFGASLLPLAWGLWRSSRSASLLGTFVATSICFASSSSGPRLSLIAGGVAFLIWPWRDRVSQIRRGVFVTIVVLHVAMKAPVWALIGRVSELAGGGTGWHRSRLIDQAVARLGEWWLVGTRSTAHWGARLSDVTNHYVEVAVDGGLVTLVLFILILVRAFARIGSALAGIRPGRHSDRGSELLLWGLGCALFVHTVSFLGVSYFDQLVVFWYITVALSGSVPVGLQHVKARSASGEMVRRAGSSGQPGFDVPVHHPQASCSPRETLSP